MNWDRNEGRFTCILPGGLVAHAVQTSFGWEVMVPGADIHDQVRNPALRTWLSARSVVERLIWTRLHDGFDDPVHDGDGLRFPPGTAGPRRRR